MLIPFGVFSAGVSGGDSGGGSFDLISTTLLTGSQASVTFDVSTLASTYKHLQLRMVARGSYAGTYHDVYMRFNSDTTSSNYKAHLLYGQGSSVNSGVWSNDSNGFRIADINGSTSTANVYAPMVTDLLDPFSTSKNKTVKTFSGATTTPFVSLSSGLWLSTSAVTSIVLASVSGSFLSGSRFSIYGIKA